jgi:hypothetical protein
MEILRPARWTLEQALQIVPSIAHIAKKFGYSVAVCGSVLLNGEGEDLDLRFIPEEPLCDAQGCINEIQTLTGFRGAGDLQAGRLGRSFTVIWLHTGQCIDAQFLAMGGNG